MRTDVHSVNMTQIRKTMKQHKRNKRTGLCHFRPVGNVTVILGSVNISFNGRFDR